MGWSGQNGRAWVGSPWCWPRPETSSGTIRGPESVGNKILAKTKPFQEESRAALSLPQPQWEWRPRVNSNSIWGAGGFSPWKLLASYAHGQGFLTPFRSWPKQLACKHRPHPHYSICNVYSFSCLLCFSPWPLSPPTPLHSLICLFVICFPSLLICLVHCCFPYSLDAGHLVAPRCVFMGRNCSQLLLTQPCLHT